MRRPREGKNVEQKQSVRALLQRHGIGSESQRPLAIVIIGGLIGATFFTLFVFPLMVEAFYRRMLYDKNGKLVQRRL